MTNTCAVCGANLAMVGRSHRCIPKPAVVSSKARSVPKAGVAVARSIRDGDGASTQPVTYKYRDAEKWRAYMRDYMRARRGSKLNAPAN